MDQKRELNMDEMNQVSGGTGEDSRYFFHTVVKGETLHKIAKLYGVSVEDLMRWNDIKDRNLIRIDQELKIYE